MRVELRQAIVVTACVVAVFAGFFALGRVTRGSSETSRAYGPQELPAVSVRAGIPYGLPAAAPIPFLLTAEAPAPQPSRNSARAVAGASSGPSEISSGASRESTPLQPAVTAPEPKPAPVQSAPAPVSRPKAAPRSSEGGSFDSSG